MMTGVRMERYRVIAGTIMGEITVREASGMLGLSERQIKRLKAGVKEYGAGYLTHGNTGRKPAHAVSEAQEEGVVAAACGKYQGANAQHLCELLAEHEGICLSRSSVSRILKRHAISKSREYHRNPHPSRERKARFGMLEQTDASAYAWFDGITGSLHGMIDDATGKVLALWLEPTECLKGYFEAARIMIRRYGCPMSLYADRHTIFQGQPARKASHADDFVGVPAPKSQFERAMSELGIALIAAHSPQAKGRVERLWGTLQSRLPLEFALAGVHSVEQANTFLASYITKHNRLFAIKPAMDGSACTLAPHARALDFILCRKESRMLDAGGCFSFQGQRYQPFSHGRAVALPSRTPVQVLFSSRIGIRLQALGTVYSVRMFPKGLRAFALDG